MSYIVRVESLSVCLLDTTGSPTETDEPIAMHHFFKIL